ncbi:MAG: septum formation protein Maf [Candidatus Melainabacteria bacterium]|nr:septum formation protein Maf [Candidatus Melainabacteria bacterium]
MANTNNKRREIVLASASPRRKKLLKLIGLKFKAVKSKVNEDSLIKKLKKSNPAELVKILSLAKAVSACHGKHLQRNEIIVGFDTIVVCKNKLIGKPKNKKDALNKILFLSDKQHEVFTGIALIDLKKKKVYVDYEMTKVKMKKISRQNAINYIKTKEPIDKAGAYAIQGIGKKFVKCIYGDYFNVVGLPLNKFLLMLGSL